MPERPRIGVVGLADGWSTEALADAVEASTGFRCIIELGKCSLDLAEGSVRFAGVDLCKLDGLIIKKLGDNYNQDMLDRLEVLRFANESGVPVFSKPASILRLLDRLSCTVTLRSGNIPMPETTITEDLDLAARAVRHYGEAVLKPLYSTKARGMTVVSAQSPSLNEELSRFRQSGNPVMYVQKKLAIPGRDLGIVFLGGKHLGTYARVKDPSSWNTTTREGGHYEAHEASAELVELARQAQSLFDLDLTSVDVVETEDGPKVFEVSAFGGFRGMRDSHGIDLARLYADYAIARARK